MPDLEFGSLKMIESIQLAQRTKMYWQPISDLSNMLQTGQFSADLPTLVKFRLTTKLTTQTVNVLHIIVGDVRFEHKRGHIGT